MLLATLCPLTHRDESLLKLFSDRKRLCPDECLLAYVLLVKLLGLFKEICNSLYERPSHSECKYEVCNYPVSFSMQVMRWSFSFWWKSAGDLLMVSEHWLTLTSIYTQTHKVLVEWVIKIWPVERTAHSDKEQCSQVLYLLQPSHTGQWAGAERGDGAFPMWHLERLLL